MKRKTHKLRNFFILIILGVLIYLGYYVFNETDVFIINDINLVGNLNVSDDEIEAELEIEDGLHYFKVNAYDLEKLLKDMPWVKDCEVTKIFPNKLEVKVVERQPVIAVYFSESYLLVDEDMILIEISNTPKNYFPVVGYDLEYFNIGAKIQDTNWLVLRNVIDLVYLIELVGFEEEPVITIKSNEIQMKLTDELYVKFGDGKNIESRFNKMYKAYVTLKEEDNARGVIISNHDGEPSLAPFGD